MGFLSVGTEVVTFLVCYVFFPLFFLLLLLLSLALLAVWGYVLCH